LIGLPLSLWLIAAALALLLLLIGPLACGGALLRIVSRLGSRSSVIGRLAIGSCFITRALLGFRIALLPLSGFRALWRAASAVRIPFNRDALPRVGLGIRRLRRWQTRSLISVPLRF
jgi:hypothetical protein